MGNTFSSDHCKQCGGRRTLRHTGRPGEYCSTKCRQAAHTERHKGLPPDTSDFDHHLHRELDAACAEIRDLQHALRTPAPAVEQPLELLLQLQRRLDQLTPPVVGRTKRLGASWEVIGRLLGMNKDTVRKKFNTSVVQRALTRTRIKGPATRSAPRHIPPATPTPPGEPIGPPPLTMRAAPLGQTDADTDLDGENSQPSPDTGPAPGPADFACILSNLQRASRHSLRALSKKSGLSPSFLSRAMNGERFPSWEATAEIARACGADPEVLKKVWDDADARRLRKPRPETLASALRFLHQRAGNPTPSSVSASSGYALAPDHITNLLDGTTIGTWEDVQTLIQTLDGEYTYFEPLWKQAAAEATASAPAPHPPGQGATNRLEELITTFNNILATGRPTTPRRPLPAPIQAATTWPGR
ncbi:helix-turn-helix transcriptional regulator (plasmid) [Streptomyces sp. NBC_00053]|uniref:helix-turn-helix domain-containing protein n=1 Tax=unclassified Streptomyces TaxID=2593676 RepID=UPI00225C02D2|nr:MULTISPECIES: helix-turn-helix transcriptional regulator [unclassified Streptomyces]MCX4400143.1 helix-turn-helix transcriptional regulator [Streptomyces sp. NBC_01767]MCX5506190.1 helix-turn-helix transcriptional regulator [Streptomyces sp. NBC_00052]MCX5554107.1 helix-turn-helix transcriptional regulator [Streptomyces sp. NBC_00051]